MRLVGVLGGMGPDLENLTFMKMTAERLFGRENFQWSVLAAGRHRWDAGARIRIYRTVGGAAAVAPDPDDERAELPAVADPRDYDVDHYVRVLRGAFAVRLARAFTPDDFATVFGDPDQLSLFATPLASIRPVLTIVSDGGGGGGGEGVGENDGDGHDGHDDDGDGDDDDDDDDA